MSHLGEITDEEFEVQAARMIQGFAETIVAEFPDGVVNVDATMTACCALISDMVKAAPLEYRETMLEVWKDHAARVADCVAEHTKKEIN